MSSLPIRWGLVFVMPLMVFILALLMGWQVAAPAPEKNDEPSRLLGPRIRNSKNHTVSRLDFWESRITRTRNVSLLEVEYNAEGFERALRDDWTVNDHGWQDVHNYLAAWIEQSPKEAYDWMNANS